MLDKLEAIQARFEQVGVALTNPEIINNQSEFGKLSKAVLIINYFPFGVMEEK